MESGPFRVRRRLEADRGHVSGAHGLGHGRQAVPGDTACDVSIPVAVHGIDTAGHCRELRRREEVVETREEAGGDALGEALEDRQWERWDSDRGDAGVPVLVSEDLAEDVARQAAGDADRDGTVDPSALPAPLRVADVPQAALCLGREDPAGSREQDPGRCGQDQPDATSVPHQPLLVRLQVRDREDGAR